MRMLSTLAGTLLLVPTASFALHLPANELQAALALPVGASAEIAGLPVSASRGATLRLRRIDVYAADAQIFEATPGGLRVLPRSDWRHYLADRKSVGGIRLALSLSADGRQAVGTLIGSDGASMSISGSEDRGGLELQVRSAREDQDGHPALYTCATPPTLQAPGSALNPVIGSLVPAAVTVASRSGTVAVDTDNEFMELKFGNNTTNASNYLAQLFAAMNVIYERDLDLTLLQGTTILRTSGTADPWTTPIGTDTGPQLTEFRNFWAANQGAVSRAFAMLLSGKSSDEFSSSGLASVLTSPTVNYCTSTAANNGHYSVTQVFRFPASNASHDVSVIAHEIGHNFGAFHTHCSNTTTGTTPASGSPIDQCYNLEGTGCHGGAESCPAATTINGVPNVRGTLMSYCHLLSGCAASDVFATPHRNLLLPRVTNNVGFGCFTSGAGPNIFANGFE